MTDIVSPHTEHSTFTVEDWGVIPYREAWIRQKSYVEERIANERADALVFCEHPAVVTLGRASQRDGESYALEAQHGIEVLEIERGGHATYHGPGQIVVYPIFKLGHSRAQASRQGVHSLIRSLEAWVVEFLKDFQLDAGTVEGKTGVWISGERKIASIGIAARHWVSYHGLALNLDTGPGPWQLISPCGFAPEIMTDIRRETGRDLRRTDVICRLQELAQKHF